MFDRFSYKQKNYGLLALCIILTIVSYKRSFSLTLLALNEIEQQNSRMESTFSADNDLLVLTTEITQLNKNIGKSNVDPNTVQKKIIESITKNKKEVQLEKIVTTHNFETVDFNIFSNQIILTGNFNSILDYIYTVENQFDYARLASFELYTDKDFNTKKTKLYGKLLFQNYKQK